MIDISDFGVVFGTVSSTQRIANKKAFRDAVKYALARTDAMLTIYIPPGTLELEMELTGSPPPDQIIADNSGIYIVGIRIAGNITIAGSGRDQTTIAWYPAAAPNVSHDLFYVDSFSAARMVEFRDLTITGPTKASTSTNIYGIHQQSDPTIPREDEALRLKRVNMRGKWSGALLTADGGMLIDIDECQFTADIGLVFCFGSSGKKRLHARNSIFDGAGISDINGAGIYVHPSVALRLSDCLFKNSTRFAVYINGTPTAKPAYCTIDNCVFEASNQKGIHSNKNIQTVVRGCEFGVNLVGIDIQPGGANITACKFAVVPIDCRPENPCTITGGGSGTSTIVTGCSFTEQADGTPARSAQHITAGLGLFLIQNCDIHMDTVSSSGVTATWATSIIVDGCVFRGTGGSAVSNIDAKMRMSDCMVEGSMRTFYIANEDSGTLELTNNACLSTTDVFGLLVTTVNDRLFGAGNIIALPSINTQSPHEKTQESYHRLAPRRCVATTVIASAATLTLNPSWDTFHVSGTTTIDTIYLGNVGILYQTHLCCSGRVYLIADGAWNTSTAGNIKPKSTAARTVDEVVTLLWDSRTAFWYEEG